MIKKCGCKYEGADAGDPLAGKRVWTVESSPALRCHSAISRPPHPILRKRWNTLDSTAPRLHVSTSCLHSKPFVHNCAAQRNGCGNQAEVCWAVCELKATSAYRKKCLFWIHPRLYLFIMQLWQARRDTFVWFAQSSQQLLVPWITISFICKVVLRMTALSSPDLWTCHLQRGLHGYGWEYRY